MVTFREIVAGSIRRFVPGAIIGQAAMIALLLIGEPVGLEWRDLTVLAGFTLLLEAGHLAALAFTRRSMRGDADVAGRRSLVAGLAAGAFHFGFAAAVGTLTEGQGMWLAALSGAAATVAVFFPWFRTAHEEPLPIVPVEADLALSEAAELEWIDRELERERLKRRS